MAAARQPPRLRPQRSLRILAIAPTGFFADYGCHVRIRGQISALAARGHQIRLVTYPSGRDVPGMHIIRPPFWPRQCLLPVGSSWRKLALDALLVPTLLSAARRSPGGPPQLIHAYLHEGALLGTLLCRWLRIPLVLDFQGSLTAEMLDHRFLKPNSLLLGPLRRLEQWIDLQPQALLASSSHAAGLLRGPFQVPGSRVHTLLDSVDPANFRPRDQFAPSRVEALRIQLGLPSGKPILVYLGLLAPYQGTHLLLQAMQALASQPTPPHCLIMGFPNVEQYRQLAKQLQVAQHVTFTGAIPYEEAPLYLALGDLALAPKLSDTEGSGKLLTYMAAGLPVVAFDTPVQREYLGSLGLYAPQGDAERLAAVINQALAEPMASAQRGRLLRRQAETRHTWVHAAEQIEQIYWQVLDPP